MSEITKENVIDFISNMTVLELSELVKELEEKFGVSAAAPVAMSIGLRPSWAREQRSTGLASVPARLRGE